LQAPTLSAMVGAPEQTGVASMATGTWSNSQISYPTLSAPPCPHAPSRRCAPSAKPVRSGHRSHALPTDPRGDPRQTLPTIAPRRHTSIVRSPADRMFLLSSGAGKHIGLAAEPR
jgi:hypothetical protein